MVEMKCDWRFVTKRARLFVALKHLQAQAFIAWSLHFTDNEGAGLDEVVAVEGVAVEALTGRSRRAFIQRSSLLAKRRLSNRLWWRSIL